MRRACGLGLRLGARTGHLDSRTSADALHRLSAGTGSAAQVRSPLSSQRHPFVRSDPRTLSCITHPQLSAPLAHDVLHARELSTRVSSNNPLQSTALRFHCPLPQGDASFALRYARCASSSPSSSASEASVAPGKEAALRGRGGHGGAGTFGDESPAPASDLRILRELGVYVWPQDRPDLRGRVVVALGLLLASKGINVQVPYLFKLAVDGLSTGGADVALTATTGLPIWGIAALTPSALLAGYGLARGGAALFNGAPFLHRLAGTPSR